MDDVCILYWESCRSEAMHGELGKMSVAHRLFNIIYFIAWPRASFYESFIFLYVLIVLVDCYYIVFIWKAVVFYVICLQTRCCAFWSGCQNCQTSYPWVLGCLRQVAKPSNRHIAKQPRSPFYRLV